MAAGTVAIHKKKEVTSQFLWKKQWRVRCQTDLIGSPAKEKLERSEVDMEEPEELWEGFSVRMEAFGLQLTSYGIATLLWGCV